MLRDEENIFISDKVYQLDSSRQDIDERIKVDKTLEWINGTGQLEGFKILKVEDNQENGMQAMAVAPIGADC